MWHTIRTRWDILAALSAAVSVALWAPPTFWKGVSSELITFFAIQAAAVLPAMIFTAGLLRPEGMSITDVRRSRKALRSQMIFWISLLAVDFATVAAIIVGGLLSWSVSASIPTLPGPYDASWLLSSSVAFLVVFASLRTIPFVKGVLSLLEFHGQMTENAIIKRNIERVREADKADLEPYKAPEGFGRITPNH